MTTPSPPAGSARPEARPTESPPLSAPPPPARVWPLLLATSALYAAFGLVYGLMQGGLPPLLRARGVDLAAIGWSVLVLVPFGLTFLWAPAIDALRPVASSPRIGWIVPMQIVIVLMLLLAAQGEEWPPARLVALGLAIAFAAATMDVALDALCTASVPARHRAAAGGLKVASLALGSIGGGGVFTALSAQWGWAMTFRLTALLSALAILPILLNRHWDRPAPGGEARRPDLLSVLRRPAGRGRLVRLALATGVMLALSFFNRVMLVDLGVPVATIGWVVGTAAPLCGLLASLAAIPLLRRAGPGTGGALFTGLCLVAAAALGFGASGPQPWLGIGGAILMNAGTSGFFALICATTLGWAQGHQPATDYAVLYGASRLAATLLVVALAQVPGRVGWPAYYAGAALALIGVSLALRRGFSDAAPTEPTGPSDAEPN